MVAIITTLGSALARSAKTFRGTNFAVSSQQAQAIDRPTFATFLRKALSVLAV